MELANQYMWADKIFESDNIHIKALVVGEYN